MVIGHPHADSVAVLRRPKPRRVSNPANEAGAPFPMKVARVSAGAGTDSAIPVVWDALGDIACRADVSDVTLQP